MRKALIIYLRSGKIYPTTSHEGTKKK